MDKLQEVITELEKVKSVFVHQDDACEYEIDESNQNAVFSALLILKKLNNEIN